MSGKFPFLPSWAWKALAILAVVGAAWLLFRNVGAALSAGLAIFVASISGEPADSPRRTASGHVPNNPPPTPNDPDAPLQPQPGSPATGPRRRRR